MRALHRFLSSPAPHEAQALALAAVTELVRAHDKSPARVFDVPTQRGVEPAQAAMLHGTVPVPVMKRHESRRRSHCIRRHGHANETGRLIAARGCVQRVLRTFDTPAITLSFGVAVRPSAL